MATLVNNFLIGADPEFVSIDPPMVHQHTYNNYPLHALYGFDHNGFVVEPHPLPSKSVREVVKNIKAGLETFAHFDKSNRKWRAGAFYRGDNRRVAMGGHVHIDKPTALPAQVMSMDRFSRALEKLEIVPPLECNSRRMEGYGGDSDIRREHGHFEYRTLPSWLFSMKTSMLAITGIKLTMFDVVPASIQNSYKDLKGWFEKFKGKDDDVDWILDRGYLDSPMEARPDRDIRSVWKLEPKEHKVEVEPVNQIQAAMEAEAQRRAAAQRIIAAAATMQGTTIW